MDASEAARRVDTLGRAAEKYEARMKIYLDTFDEPGHAAMWGILRDMALAFRESAVLYEHGLVIRHGYHRGQYNHAVAVVANDECEVCAEASARLGMWWNGECRILGCGHDCHAVASR